MVEWYSPTHEIDEVRGGRILMLVRERLVEDGPLVDRLVILELGDGCWESPDPVYTGYSPGDSICWCWEKDLLESKNTTEFISVDLCGRY